MAMAADSSANHHSPRAREFSCDGGTVNRRTSLPSPWAKVVRGGDVESVSAVNQSPPSMGTSAPEQTPFSDCSLAARYSPPPLPPHTADGSPASEGSNEHNGNAGGPKKPAWNKPSNGVVEIAPVTVMGAVSWPALSECTKASPKLPADSSHKTGTDATTTHGSLPFSQGPETTHSPNSKKHPTNNANPNSTPTHTLPSRQKSMKRGSGSNTGGGHAHIGFAHPLTPPPPPPPPPPFPVIPILPNGYGNLIPAMPNPSPRDHSIQGNNWDARPVGGFVPQSHPVNDHRNSRRGNFGPHPRRDGQYHNNQSGKRDQDRGNYINGRDAHMNQHRAPPRGLTRSAPPNTAAFTPQSMRPFTNPMGFPEFVYIPTLPLDPIRGMPFISQPPHPAMFIPVAESPLSSLIVNQIDYYFSDANLIKDDFLRSNMDAQGWVPISLIASFPRVKGLTTSIQLILDSLRASSIVEVQDDKVRRRYEWMKWIPATGQLPTESGSACSDVLSYNISSFEKMSMEEVAPSQDIKSVTPESCATESTGQS